LTGNDIGVVGLAVMGRNLALNIADRGFAVAAYNRSDEATRSLVASLEPAQRVTARFSLDGFVKSLKRPRLILLMVKAGAPVDAVISQLEPLLEPGDIVMDGGNSHFTDTDRRGRALSGKGIHFFGVGISGGEVGARRGPSLMPGGPQEAYPHIRPVLEAIAARAGGSPCVSYLGSGAVGHYVKMVHNGIEYGVMQLIAETYAVMKRLLGFSNERLADTYAEWLTGDLSSYLLEITAGIFRKRDPETRGYLVDLILPEAEQKGTGQWASQSALDLHVPVPNIDVAVGMRNLSALEGEREEARKLFGAGPPTEGMQGVTAESVREAFHAAVVVTYAQGFALLQKASLALEYGMSLREVAGVWRGGCIIRSALLPGIMAAFERRPDLPNLLLDQDFARQVASRRPHLVSILEAAMSGGIPAPGFAASLAYLDTYAADWSPLNLTQAQRDYFGSHQYRRVDREGTFHTDWDAGEGV
jgi:6-phosphogluconate dehydrogenase